MESREEMERRGRGRWAKKRRGTILMDDSLFSSTVLRFSVFRFPALSVLFFFFRFPALYVLRFRLPISCALPSSAFDTSALLPPSIFHSLSFASSSFFLSSSFPIPFLEILLSREKDPRRFHIFGHFFFFFFSSCFSLSLFLSVLIV